MAKSKFIEDEERLKYKQHLAELMQQINPKESETVIKKLKEKYLDSRGEK